MSTTTPADPGARRSLPVLGEGSLRDVGRIVLGVGLAIAGLTHLTTAREEFQAQVPGWVPLDEDLVVVLSGVVEIALGLALLLLVRRRVLVGWVVAAFFVAIFPGNVSQYVDGVDAFGLDSDRERLVRLFFQPVVVGWALWSTQEWKSWRAGHGLDADRAST